MPQRRGTLPVSDAEVIACPDTYVRGVPYDRLERLRARTPVVWVDGTWLEGMSAGDPGCWQVLRYADVRRALARPQVFVSEPDGPVHGPVADPGPAPDPGGDLIDMEPQGDLIDMEPPARALVARIAGEGATDMVTEVLAGLPGTLRNTLAGGAYALLRAPDQYAALRARRHDPALLDSAVEEVLRWWTPVMQLRRTVRRHARLGGVPMLPSERVALWLTAADHDDAAFDEPGRFVAGRYLPRGNGGAARPHLALGLGPHSCLGAGLARVHLRALLAALLDRPGRLVSAGEPVRIRSSARHGFEHLPVRWAR